jgi:hypothetical protein
MKTTTDVLRPKRPPIPSSCTPEQLGAALAAANLASIEDPDKRALAFLDALTRLMINTADSPRIRGELLTARLEAARRGQTFR